MRMSRTYTCLPRLRVHSCLLPLSPQDGQWSRGHSLVPTVERVELVVWWEASKRRGRCGCVLGDQLLAGGGRVGLDPAGPVAAS